MKQFRDWLVLQHPERKTRGPGKKLAVKLKMIPSTMHDSMANVTLLAMFEIDISALVFVQRYQQ